MHHRAVEITGLHMRRKDRHGKTTLTHPPHRGRPRGAPGGPPAPRRPTATPPPPRRAAPRPRPPRAHTPPPPAAAPLGGGGGPSRAPKPTLNDKGDHYEIRTADVVLHVAKHPLTLALYRTDGPKLFSETKPLAWTDKSTTESLTRGAQEQFFGTGEQNGGFSFRDKTVNVANSFDWDEGGYNNSQP